MKKTLSITITDNVVDDIVDRIAKKYGKSRSVVLEVMAITTDMYFTDEQFGMELEAHEPADGRRKSSL